MTTTSKDWKEVLVEKLKEAGELQRGQLSTIFKDLAETYELKVSQISNYYYRTLREAEDEVVEVQTAPEFAYKVGDTVDIEVTAIVGFGAFCKILDGTDYPALIHIKHITGLYVADVEDYFTVGDKLQAKVQEVTPDKKISLTTKGMTLPSTMPAQYRHEFVRPIPQEPFTNTGLADKLANVSVVEPEVAVGTTLKEISTSEIPEMQEIIRFLNSNVGMVSPKAQLIADSIIKEHGMFRFTLAMAKVAQSFENDLGIHLMKEIKQSVGDCL